MINNEEQFISFISNGFRSISELPNNWVGIGDDASSNENFACQFDGGIYIETIIIRDERSDHGVLIHLSNMPLGCTLDE